MARNRSFDYSDDDDFSAASHSSTHINDAELSESGSAGLPGMGEDLIGDTASGQRSGKRATERAAQQSQQAQTATQTRSASAASQQAESPTSMNDKRGNQPR